MDPSYPTGARRNPDSQDSHHDLTTRFDTTQPLPPEPSRARLRALPAGGIGITPILPMIGQAAAAGADWTLVYGGRTGDSMAFTDELAHHGDRVALWPQEGRGHIDLATLLALPVSDTLVYVCGPTLLLDVVEERCAAWPAGALHLERFAAKDVLTSCGEGTCGTCETPVLEGVPDHRDSVLTPGEQEQNDCMMVCISRSCSKRLVLDL